MATRILVGVTNVLDVTFYVNEAPMDADGTVTCTITDFNGTQIDQGDATHAGTGNYTCSLEPQTNPKFIEVEWSGEFNSEVNTVVHQYELVGNHYFSLAELRSMDGLGDDDVFPADALVVARDWATSLINEYTDTSFCEAYHSQYVDGTTSFQMVLEKLPVRRLINVDKDGTTVDIDDWKVNRSGRVRSDLILTRGYDNYFVEYVYGERVCPQDLKQAALRLARYFLLNNQSSIPDRARMMTTEWGTFQLSTANSEYPTGLPEIDSVLWRYNHTLPGFA